MAFHRRGPQTVYELLVQPSSPPFKGNSIETAARSPVKLGKPVDGAGLKRKLGRQVDGITIKIQATRLGQPSQRRQHGRRVDGQVFAAKLGWLRL